MSDEAERWLSEQEIELLERIDARESPPGHKDPREVIRVEARKVGVYKRPTNAPSNETITE